MENPIELDSEILNEKIEGLNLSIRRYNCLKYNGINTIEELIQLFKTGEISKAKNLGEKGVQEVKQKLALKGIKEQYLECICNKDLKRKRAEREQINIQKIKKLLELGLPKEICYKLARNGIYRKEDLCEAIKTGRIKDLEKIGPKRIAEILQHVNTGCKNGEINRNNANNEEER